MRKKKKKKTKTDKKGMSKFHFISFPVFFGFFKNLISTGMGDTERQGERFEKGLDFH